MNEQAPLFSIEPTNENIVGAPDWTKIEVEYRAGKPLRAISEQFGIGKNVISRKAKREGWQKGGTSPGQTQEKPGTSELVPPPSDDDEYFDWSADDIVVLDEQPRTALYFNSYGALVIRQERYYHYDTSVFITMEYVESFLDKIKSMVGSK